MCWDPCQTEVSLLVADIEKAGSKHIELPEFLAMMAKKLAQAESPASCIAAFKVPESFAALVWPLYPLTPCSSCSFLIKRTVGSSQLRSFGTS